MFIEKKNMYYKKSKKLKKKYLNTVIHFNEEISSLN